MSGILSTSAKSRKWQDPSKFKISITGAGASLFGNLSPEDLSIACSSIALAGYNITPIESYIGEEWRFAIGRMEALQVDITFKDFDNFKLYRAFSKGLQDSIRMFPDSIKIDLDIQTSSDFDIESFVDTVTFKDCILTSVGGATLDNSAVASVAEVTINLKCSYAITH